MTTLLLLENVSIQTCAKDIVEQSPLDQMQSMIKWNTPKILTNWCILLPLLITCVMEQVIVAMPICICALDKKWIFQNQNQMSRLRGKWLVVGVDLGRQLNISLKWPPMYPSWWSDNPPIRWSSYQMFLPYIFISSALPPISFYSSQTWCKINDV